MENEAVVTKIRTELEAGNVEAAKMAAGEFNRSRNMELCFTSRQIRGIRILDKVLDIPRDKMDEELIEILDELAQIKYVIEKALLDAGCENYSKILQGFAEP